MVFGATECGLDLAAFGEVAHDAREADDAAGGAVEGGDGFGGPEAGAVLADVRVLGLGAAVGVRL
jgi:hypothetical protein